MDNYQNDIVEPIQTGTKIVDTTVNDEEEELLGEDFDLSGYSEVESEEEILDDNFDISSYKQTEAQEPVEPVEPVLVESVQQNDDLDTYDNPPIPKQDEDDTPWFYDTEEQKIAGEALAKAQQIVTADKFISSMKSIATGEELDAKAFQIAGDYLLKEGDIQGYDVESQTFLMQDGTELKPESSIMSTLAANKWETLYSATYGIVGGGTVGYATKGNPFAILTAGQVSSVAGSAAGARLDALENSKFLGYDISNDEIFRAMAEAGTDDAFFGTIISGLVKVGKASGVGEKFTRIKNALLNNDADGAWDTVMKMTDKSDEEINAIIAKGAEFWNMPKPDITTTKGKQEAIGYLAMYDDSLESYAKASGKLSQDAVVNIYGYMKKKTADLQGFLKAGDTNAFQAMYDIDKKSSEFYGQMMKTFETAFQDKGINAIPLYNRFKEVGRILNKNTPAFNEQTRGKVESIMMRINKMLPVEGRTQTSIEDIILLNKEYNGLMRDIKRKGSPLTKAEYRAVGEGKNLILNFLKEQVDKNPNLAKREKKQMMSLFNQANTNIKIVKDVIGSDLWSTVTTKNKNISSRNKHLDALIEKAKETKLDRGLDDTSRLLNLLDNEQALDVEAMIIDRVINKSLFVAEGKKATKLANFGAITKELKQIEHVFKSPEAKQALKKLKHFENIFTNDDVLYYISTFAPQAKTEGGGLSTSITGAAHISAVKHAYAKLQVVLPAILKEFGTIGNLMLKGPVLRGFRDVSSQRAVELNMADALAKSKDLPNFLTTILKDESIPLSSHVKGGMMEIIKQYSKIATELENLPYAERESLRQERIREQIAQQRAFEEAMATRRREALARSAKIEGKAVPQPVPETKIDNLNANMSKLMNNQNFKMDTTRSGRNIDVRKITDKEGNTIWESSGTSGVNFRVDDEGIISGWTLGLSEGSKVGGPLYKSLWDGAKKSGLKYAPSNSLTNSNHFRMTANMLQYAAKNKGEAKHLLLGQNMAGVPASLHRKPLTKENAKTVIEGYKNFFNNNLLPVDMQLTAKTTDKELEKMAKEYGRGTDRKFGVKTLKLMRNFLKSGNIALSAGFLVTLSNQKDFMKAIEDYNNQEEN